MVIGKLRRYLATRRENAKLTRVYAKYRDHTMVPQSLFIRNLQLVEEYRNVPGCVVECGVWRGGMIAGMAEVLGDDRAYVLFDSFEGLPPAKEVDGPAALAWQSDTAAPGYYDNCAAERRWAEEAMARARVRDARFVQGWFDQTVPVFTPPGPIAVLRLDGDWYDSIMVCLTHLVPHIAPGGVVILDDYYTWDGCSRAVHDYLAAQKSTARIAQFRDGVCYLQFREQPTAGGPNG